MEVILPDLKFNLTAGLIAAVLGIFLLFIGLLFRSEGLSFPLLEFEINK